MLSTTTLSQCDDDDEDDGNDAGNDVDGNDDDVKGFDRASVEDPIPLSPEEVVYIDKLSSKGPIHALFKKLCIYFRGSHHLEEIMYRENITRSELRAVLSTFSDIAVSCLHE